MTLAGGCEILAAGDKWKLLSKMTLRSMHSIQAECTRHTWSLERPQSVASSVQTTMALANDTLSVDWRKL